ncbi:uncharacterized protein LOC124186584 [Neodiprion fabricii]|uniref:uncharacterized protein LOC124186584 n=1 Tax=Neodiprion fabricii TaxID=2872261 RepID=UPI001ED8EFB7|nr:uncharacterized protein LOC124186584 [Neodiprion fabricii]
MKKDNSFDKDLEGLKTSDKDGRKSRNDHESGKEKQDHSDIVHASFRFLQCIAAGLVFVYHIIGIWLHGISDLSDLSIIIIYPCCFLASLVLAISRMLKFIPNPKPIVPVTISLIGWICMLTGAILIMRHAELSIDVHTMTDHEIAESPIFIHDLSVCALSLIGSSVYIVHAWLLYDCWWWDKKKEKEMQANESAGESINGSRNGMTSGATEAKYRPDGTSGMTLPGTSSGQNRSNEPGNTKVRRTSKLLEKLRGNSKTEVDEIDPFVDLDKILQESMGPKEINIEDEPVQLYCCCVEFIRMLKQECKSSVPGHEFQVVHVM